MIPTIKLMQALHISGEFIGLILFLTALYLPLTIVIMSGFVKGLPREIDEAATIDGAGSFYTFTRIIFPLLKPSIATVTVFVAIYAWNDFLNTLYIISDSNKWTLPFSVYNFVSQYGTEWQFVFADLLSVMVPILIIYLFLQRYIIEGMTAGSVKGYNPKESRKALFWCRLFLFIYAIIPGITSHDSTKHFPEMCCIPVADDSAYRADGVIRIP